MHTPWSDLTWTLVKRVYFISAAESKLRCWNTRIWTNLRHSCAPTRIHNHCSIWWERQVFLHRSLQPYALYLLKWLDGPASTVLSQGYFSRDTFLINVDDMFHSVKLPTYINQLFKFFPSAHNSSYLSLKSKTKNKISWKCNSATYNRYDIVNP